MTHRTDPDLLNNILQLISDQGTDGLAEGIRLLVNQAMHGERSQALQAKPYERSLTRTGSANGFKDKTLTTRLGPITFDIPQVRGDLDFYPTALEKGRRSEQALKLALLGVSVALSEAEVHWRAFLQSLLHRGLCGVALIVSDDHSGLKAARTAVFPAVPWQRCQFHLQQNAQAYVPRLDQRAEVARAIRSVFDSPSRPAAEARLKEIVAHYANSAPKLAAWLEENLPQGLTVFGLPAAHQQKMRTSNALERVNQELKRRTRVARLFPNEAALLRLITALLVETSEEWETGKIYLNINPETQASV